jgi:hypothetical protein
MMVSRTQPQYRPGFRDAGSYGDLVFAARQAMRYGAFRGPRLLACARIIAAIAPGGRWFGDMYREVDDPDDARRAVREQYGAAPTSSTS